MDPFTLMSIFGAVQSVFQLGTGISQQIQADKFRSEFEKLGKDRPKYSTPEEILNSLQLISQGFSDPRMAGQGRLEDLTGLNFANTVQAGVQGGDPFAVLSAAQGRADITSQEIQTRQAQMNEQERINLAQALNTVAGFKDQEWQMNEFAPWRDRYQFILNEYRDKLQAGGKNTFEGLGGLGQVGMTAMMGGGGGSTPVDVNALMQILQKYTSQSTTQAPAGVGDFFYSPDIASLG